MSASDTEANRFSARAARYARVGANMGGVAARMAGARLLGLKGEDLSNAAALAQALGGLKGPIMKVAQLLATVPDLLPPEYAAELQKLQSEAPPMGAAFVKRRMAAELGPDWQGRFGSFDLRPAAAASLGQVHRATARDGAALACKLQYPDMQSAVEADLKQLEVAFALHRRLRVAIDTREIAQEIGDRVREELDYQREAKHAALYAEVLRDIATVRVPGVHPDLSTKRLLTLGWLDGEKILTFAQAPLEIRNRLAHAMFKAWWHPFSRAAVIHGDPHLGNYTVAPDRTVNLLDFGCIRIFPTSFVKGVIDLYHALERNDRDLAVEAYSAWGFGKLSNEMIAVLNRWAAFVYGPLLDDRTRPIQERAQPGREGRSLADDVHRDIRQLGGIAPPRAFVFMDRAAVGLGSVFMHLKAQVNWHRIFHELIDDFDATVLAARQRRALAEAGVPPPS